MAPLTPLPFSLADRDIQVHRERNPNSTIAVYAVYQCGGCGAVLRAGNKHIDSGVSSDKSGDESDVIRNKTSKPSVNQDLSNRSVKNMSLVSENGIEYNEKLEKHGKDDNGNMEFDELRSRRSVGASNWRYRELDFQEGSTSYHHATRHEYAELVQNVFVGL